MNTPKLLSATLFLVLAGCSRPEARRHTPALVGAWRSAIHFDSGPLASMADLQFLYVFNDGGTLTESSNYDAVPPVAPAYGVWKEVGPNEFVARYEFFLTKPPAHLDDLTTGGGWLPAGRGVLSEQIQVAVDGKSFISTIRYQGLDANGAPAPDAAVGRGRAMRMSLGPASPRRAPGDASASGVEALRVKFFEMSMAIRGSVSARC